MKARKKPIVIDVWKWDGTTTVLEQLKAAGMTAGYLVEQGHVTILKIKTLEGEMEAQIGDWIIKGVVGEFYPCKPDIFELTYEMLGEKGV